MRQVLVTNRIDHALEGFSRALGCRNDPVPNMAALHTFATCSGIEPLVVRLETDGICEAFCVVYIETRRVNGFSLKVCSLLGT